MTDALAISIAQLNPTLGAIADNVAKIRAARARAGEDGADLLLTPELSVIGYPPEDLILKPALQDAAAAAVRELARDTADGGPAMIVGACWREDGRLYNAVFLLDGGRVAATRYKHELPNYGVFDEKRIFEPGPLAGPVSFRGVRLGLLVCEDMWFPEVAECLGETGSDILLVPTCSPYEEDKYDERMTHAVARVTESGLGFVFANQVGGQDELVFDGASFVVNSDHTLAAQLPAWREAQVTTHWRRTADGWRCEPGEVAPGPDGLDAVYQAMMLGLRDYVDKNRFPGVVLGLSGGIDSALTAAVAVDALGADAVHVLMMPSRYTSQDSLDDAADCAERLGIRLDTVRIEPAVDAFDSMLKPLFDGANRDTTEENIQARLRAILLMAVSNKFGHMLLTTGNKSEMSVGYATLYGDMCGGYSVLKDVYKTRVFELARWRNTVLPEGARGPEAAVIPDRIITKPPTAELRENQKDEDSLPPYDQLDDILECLIEREMSTDQIVTRGHDREVVARIERLVHIAEYKRRQAPPGVKITRRNFGRDRRYPITHRFHTTSEHTFPDVPS